MMKNYNLSMKMLAFMAVASISLPLQAFDGNGLHPKAVSKVAYQGEHYSHMVVSSGFNEDIIANGIGNLSASVTEDVDDADYVFLSKGLQLTATSTPITFGLPANGLISNLHSPHTYQLASYSANNSLRLAAAGSEGTLQFSNAQSLEKLFLLVTSAGGANITGTINFSDGTKQNLDTFIVPSWFDKSGLPMVATGVGRGNRTNNAFDDFGDAPNLFQIEVSISAANKSKLVSGVTITKNTATGVFNLMSATGLKVTNAPSNSGPLAITSGFNYDIIANGTGAATASTTNDVDGAKYAFVAVGLKTKETGTPTTYGFAEGGMIDNMAVGPNYKLGSFTANNTLRLSTGMLEGKVSFAATKTESLYLLVTSSNGADVTFKLHFADGTTEDVAKSVVPGWFSNANTGLDMVATGVGRVNVDSGDIEYFNNSPSLFQIVVPVSTANKTKELNGVTATMAPSTSVFNLLAVSGVNTTLGTEDFAMANTTVFPNPVNDVLSIVNADSLDNVSVFSVSGQLLREVKSNISQVSFSGLATGIYFVKLTSTSGSTKTIKVMKV
jgi:hypothetical protein